MKSVILQAEATVKHKTPRSVVYAQPHAPDLDDAWLDEIERRIDDIESGRVKGIPAEVVFAEARARLRTPG